VKFQFKLERLLGFIRLKETMKKMEIASVNKKIAFLEHRISLSHSSLRKILEKCYEGNSQDYEYYHTNQVALDAGQLKKLNEAVVVCKREKEDKVQELNRLMMRRKGLESLREKRWQEHRKVVSKKAQKDLDEAFQLTEQAKQR